ncbi:MAG: hypothetical protein R6U04_05545 [Bacteroidales bacterium]
MKIEYQVFEKENLLIHKFYDRWSTREYKDYITFSIKNLNLGVVNKILTDLRELEAIQPLFDEINQIQAISKEIPLDKYINVHLVTDPMLTVASHIYQQTMSPGDKIQYTYCSTLAYSLELLNLNINSQEAEKRINNLEFSFNA